MIERKLLNKNELTIVGTLVDVAPRTGESAKGPYISGTASIKSNEQVFPVRFFSNQLTKDGNVSKLYETYANLANLIGKRVRVDGSLEESKVYKDGKLNKGNSLTLKFVKELRADDTQEDCARFSIEGFIETSLHDVYNANGDVVANQIVIGQANYNNTKAVLLRLSVDPANTKAIEKLQEYDQYSTLRVSGDLAFEVDTIQRVVENDFGRDEVSTSQRNIKKYIINGGKLITDEALEYSNDEINELLRGSKADDDAQINRGGGAAVANVKVVPHNAGTPRLV